MQERAWSSPIWYTPTAAARGAAKKGPTVAELLRQGAVALDDAKLRELAVGRTLRVRNAVTGQVFEILYGTGGQRIVTAMDGETPRSNPLGEAFHGARAPYEIRDGRLVTQIAGTPFEVTVYRLGERFVAARGDELGYANYEVEKLDR